MGFKDNDMHLIVGLGKTGHSIARYLTRRNQSFVVFDTRLEPTGLEEFYAEFPGADIFLGKVPDILYEKLTEIISSPGVSLDHPCLRKARDLGISIIGDVECFARSVQAPVIAITGTNGKSTVTTLVGEMAKAAGLNSIVAGNIGYPVLDLMDDGINYDLWVLELSSFQLDLINSLAPIAATILNITPDHLDRHHHLEAYIQAKQRVYHQAKMALYHREDERTRPLSCVHQQSYGLDLPAIGHWGIRDVRGVPHLACGEDLLLSVNALHMKGRHNWQNALAACALAEAAQIPRACMIEVLQRFSGLPHRTQWVRTKDGVDWIDDSKGTNIGATVSAISGIGGSMQGKVILIAGGQGKGADFTELRESISDYVRSMVLIGEDAPLMEKALTDVVPITHALSLEEAVEVAQTLAKPGDVVLLSPACASLDMFRDFNHRGEVFTCAVNAL